MESLVKKVIRASAGTGKTYRLSLEYIGLLLRYRPLGLSFSEILVITFTRKATAEIRDRIFRHLQLLCEQPQSTEAKKVEENLWQYLGLRIGESERRYLGEVYQEMLFNKNRVAISTIDAFTKKIFDQIIAPYLGLQPRDIKQELESTVYDQLNALALSPDIFPTIEAFFRRCKKRKLGDYENLLRSLTENRWIFHFLELFAPSHDDLMQQKEKIEQHLQAFRHHFTRLLDLLQTHLLGLDKPLTGMEALKKNYHFYLGNESPPLLDVPKIIAQKIADDGFLEEHLDELLSDEPFWNRTSLFRSKTDKPSEEHLLAELQLAKTALADYAYLTLFLKEEKELQQIAEKLLEKYDQLTLHERDFTHADITYTTFRHLYDAQLSLLEGDSVSNVFYEMLAANVRFLLIDEFQDTSVLQMKILLPIIREVISGEGIKPYGGVIVVGDEKQSIYGWRGGERDLLLAMPGLLHGASQEELQQSHRSRPAIMAFINAFFGDTALHERLQHYHIHWPYEPCSTVRSDTDGAIWVRIRNLSESATDDELTLSAHRELAAEIYTLIQENKIVPHQTAILARTNEDLRRLSAAFDELGLEYILESSYPLMQHRAIKPLMMLLEYLSRWDVNDLLKFLRSDYVLLSGKDLKRVLLVYRQWQRNEDRPPLWQALATNLADIDALQRIAQIIAKNKELDLLNLCKAILEDFAVLRIFPLQNDAKNIHRFLEVVASFADQRQYPYSLAGFLRYRKDNWAEDVLQQVGLEEVDALQLLTIHKAKGQEFENVFIFWDTTSGSKQREGGMKMYLRYSADFDRIENYAMTYIYDRVLQNSSTKILYEEQIRREAIETLNTFYVAMTRARSNLGIYVTFQKKDGIEKWIEDNANADKIAMDRWVVAHLYQLLSQRGPLTDLGSNGGRALIGQFARTEEEGETNEREVERFASGYLDIDRRRFYRQRPVLEEEAYLDYKSMFLKKRHMDRGIVVHYYLSLIPFASAEAQQIAAVRTLAFFGTLLPVGEIRNLVEKADAFIATHGDIFSAQHWNNAFTEYTVFAPDGRELRLDRMLVSEPRKEILIIDFKTGEAYDEQQLLDYVRAVKSLPYVKEKNYSVRGVFMEIDL